MNTNKPTTGFTLIEIIVVIAVISIILPTLFAIIFTLLRMQLQISRLQRIKEAGDYVTSTMITTVRSFADTVDETCANDPDLDGPLSTSIASITFRDIYDVCFGYYIDNNNALASISANLDSEPNNSIYLVSTLDSDYPLSITNPSLVKVNDKLAKIKFVIQNQPTVDYLSAQSLNYQFYIYIRN